MALQLKDPNKTQAQIEAEKEERLQKYINKYKEKAKKYQEVYFAHC